MKQLLLVQPDSTESSELTRVLSLRQDGLSHRAVASLDAARREVKEKKWDAVLIAPGHKTLSLTSFLKFATTQPTPPRLLLVGEHDPAVTTVEPGSAERIVDQVLAILGLTRSATFDSKVIEELGFAGSVEFARVAWPGAPEPVLRAQVRRGEFDPQALSSAQRAGAAQPMESRRSMAPTSQRARCGLRRSGSPIRGKCSCWGTASRSCRTSGRPITACRARRRPRSTARSSRRRSRVTRFDWGSC